MRLLSDFLLQERFVTWALGLNQGGDGVALAGVDVVGGDAELGQE